MPTNVRPELSKRNKYWIPKHRYYELKHFCLQYPEWKEQLKHVSMAGRNLCSVRSEQTEWHDPVHESSYGRDECLRKIRMVEECARLASSDLGKYILRAVTEDLSFTHLKMMLDIPCGKNAYYEAWRKFFFILSAHR